MKKNLSVLLSAALLLGGLTACHSPAAPADVSDSGNASSGPTSSSLGPAFGSDASEPLPEPPEPALAFDPDYTLDIDYPKVAKGALELPVRGATGYASVRLPIWEEIPEPEPEPEPPEEPPEEPQPPDVSAPADPGVPPEESPADPGVPEEPAPQEPEDTEAPPVPEPDGSQPAAPPAGPEEPVVPPDQPAESQPPVPKPDDETIYPPGEEPIPEQPEPEEDPFEGAAAVLDPGTAFLIREEDPEGEWWYIHCRAGEGWIENRYCLINLPDVIPSMGYNATNSYDSRYVSLGRDIPNITGRAFYPRGSYNERLERNEFMMPVLYSMAKRICQAQQAALAQGNTLVLYEGYRPHEVQTAVYKALSALTRSNSAVKEATTAAPWNLSWFIAGGYSNHQRGFAIDITLAQVQRAELQDIGGHTVLRVREYEEYAMPTPIHELSRDAATFTKPVASHSPTAWKSAQLTDAMRRCEPALALQRYCTGAELTPLASEWWHFNDLDTRAAVLDNLSTGDYKISACLSTAP